MVYEDFGISLRASSHSHDLEMESDFEYFENVFLTCDTVRPQHNRVSIASIDGTLKWLKGVTLSAIYSLGCVRALTHLSNNFERKHCVTTHVKIVGNEKDYVDEGRDGDKIIPQLGGKAEQQMIYMCFYFCNYLLKHERTTKSILCPFFLAILLIFIIIIIIISFLASPRTFLLNRRRREKLSPPFRPLGSR